MIERDIPIHKAPRQWDLGKGQMYTTLPLNTGRLFPRLKPATSSS
uniref:Uncharacterized protein n=1 Tax=Rhizophora mucronata TaxID=61149 RepID=A0A2P2Q3T0_RHIMU